MKLHELQSLSRMGNKAGAIKVSKTLGCHCNHPLVKKMMKAGKNATIQQTKKKAMYKKFKRDGRI